MADRQAPHRRKRVPVSSPREACRRPCRLGTLHLAFAVVAVVAIAFPVGGGAADASTARNQGEREPKAAGDGLGKGIPGSVVGREREGHDLKGTRKQVAPGLEPAAPASSVDPNITTSVVCHPTGPWTEICVLKNVCHRGHVRNPLWYYLDPAAVNYKKDKEVKYFPARIVSDPLPIELLGSHHA